jgi:hypothetical protein
VGSATVSPSELTLPVASQNHVSTRPRKRRTRNHSTNGPWKCWKCNRGFDRKQERDRHYFTHFPFWVYCRSVGCSFRTDRPTDFRKHWAVKHENEGPVPGKEEFEIYNPAHTLLWIDFLTFDEATEFACVLVDEKARQIGKQDLWEDSWGRKVKKAQVAQHGT